MPTEVKIVALLDAKAGKSDALWVLLQGILTPSCAEPGNLRYDLWQDQADPDRFVMDELYKGKAAIAAHRATPHFEDYLARIGDVAERQILLLNPVNVA
jgi:quinol monooxygenase YgiN